MDDACLREEEERGGIIKDPSALGTDWLVLYHFWETPTLGSHAHTRSPQKRPDIPKQKAKTLFYGLENKFQRERPSSVLEKSSTPHCEFKSWRGWPTTCSELLINLETRVSWVTRFIDILTATLYWDITQSEVHGRARAMIFPHRGTTAHH